MSWHLKGTYFETCSCELMCPCNFSFDHGATYDYCRVSVERAPIEVVEEGLRPSVRIRNAIDFEIEDIVRFGIETGEPARLTGVFHLAGSELTAAEAKRSQISAFGIEYVGCSVLSLAATGLRCRDRKFHGGVERLVEPVAQRFISVVAHFSAVRPRRLPRASRGRPAGRLPYTVEAAVQDSDSAAIGRVSRSSRLILVSPANGYPVLAGSTKSPVGFSAGRTWRNAYAAAAAPRKSARK